MSTTTKINRDLENKVGLIQQNKIKKAKKYHYNAELGLQFEIRRGTSEITLTGNLESILDFCRLGIIEKTDTGYKVGYLKKDGTVTTNVKNYKYFINSCIYKEDIQNTIRKNLNLPQNTKLYFYRPKMKLLSEEETILHIQQRLHFKNLYKFIKYFIKEQKTYHNALGLQYNLEFNLYTIKKCNALMPMLKDIDSIKSFFENCKTSFFKMIKKKQENIYRTTK